MHITFTLLSEIFVNISFRLVKVDGLKIGEEY